MKKILHLLIAIVFSAIQGHTQNLLPLFADYFQSTTLQSINPTSTAGQVSSFTLDPNCETLSISVTDPTNTPLPSFNAYIVNPSNMDGEDLVNITGNVDVTMRVQSKEAVNVDILFRSGEGSSSERTDRKTVTIPGGLEDWTSFTIRFDSSEYAGFNPNDLRDMWFYLDRGTENFAGNEFYIDHIVIGGLPDTTLNSTCKAGNPTPSSNAFAEYFQDDPQQSINPSSTAGAVSTFTLDTICETLQISVSDPENAPLPNFNAYIVNPIDEEGKDLTDISNNVNVTMRVRSLEAVTVDILFRSGGGSQEERTERKSVSIPGGLDEWTSFSVSFSEADLSGFDPKDLRDLWFYLDRGTPNFAGNEFYIDHILIGLDPDSTRFSPCSNEIQAQTWVENWDNDNPITIGGAETSKLNLSITECEELKIEVRDPENNPHLFFRPLVIHPVRISGGPLTDISENVQVTIRARSAAEVPIGVLLRSGDGSADFRTPLQTEVVEGTLEAWTTLTYTFDNNNIGGFNPEDLVDLWVFLDRNNDNFPGNEIYFDFISIGEQADSTLNSPCDLPDFVSSTVELDWNPFYEVYPNPVQDQLLIQFDPARRKQDNMSLRLIDLNGQILSQQVLPTWQEQLSLDVSQFPSGLMFLQISGPQYHFTTRIVKK